MVQCLSEHRGKSLSGLLASRYETALPRRHYQWKHVPAKPHNSTALTSNEGNAYYIMQVWFNWNSSFTKQKYSFDVRNPVTATVSFIHSHQRKPSAPIRISATLIYIFFFFVSTSVPPDAGKVLQVGTTASLQTVSSSSVSHKRCTECAHSAASLDG